MQIGEAKETLGRTTQCNGIAKKHKVTNSKGMAWIGKAMERQRSAREWRRNTWQRKAKEWHGIATTGEGIIKLYLILEGI